MSEDKPAEIVVGSISFGEKGYEHGYGKSPIIQGWKKPGLVKVRPCADEYENKTFVGIYIGDAALSVHPHHDPETKNLDITFAFYNPAIFVPELGKIIYGCESWWGKIDSIEDVKDITDEDIDNVWYVQMLKAMDKPEGG